MPGKALHHRHDGTSSLTDEFRDSALEVSAFDLVVEDAKHLRQNVGVSRRQEPEFERDRQHPRSHRRVRGEHAVHQLCRDVGHPSLSATRTITAIAAREPHREFEEAPSTLDPRESSIQTTAVQVATERRRRSRAAIDHGDHRWDVPTGLYSGAESRAYVVGNTVAAARAAKTVPTALGPGVRSRRGTCASPARDPHRFRRR